VIGVDTNVLVRYLTQDDPRQSLLANRLIEQRLSAESPGHISLAALAETIGVLLKHYGASPAQVLTAVANLASDARFVVQHVHAVWLALEACEDGGVQLSDALIRYLDLEQGCATTVTFDRKASRHAGFELLR
jgi:predicted nucleic-acid-binding protein